MKKVFTLSLVVAFLLASTSFGGVCRNGRCAVPVVGAVVQAPVVMGKAVVKTPVKVAKTPIKAAKKVRVRRCRG